MKSEKENKEGENLPGVLERSLGVPDNCRAGAERCQDSAGQRFAHKNITSQISESEKSDVLAPTSLIVKGVVRCGDMRTPREHFQHHENLDLRTLLATKCTQRDCVIEAVGNTEFSVLDADTHHWATKPSENELQAYILALEPMPDAAWTSHNHGIKGVFIGPYHEDRALAACFSVPPSFTVELLRHTRHPLSARTDMPHARCGRVSFEGADPAGGFTFNCCQRLKPDQKVEALEKLGLKAGSRYDHAHCPLDPNADSSAKDCVVVYREGVFCFRCQAKGIRYAPYLAAGFYPLSESFGGKLSPMQVLARSRVHWIHAVYELRYHYPNLNDSILKKAYQRTLQSTYETTDPRIEMVFNRDLDFVRGEGLWFDVNTFRPTKMDNDAAGSMPYVCYVKKGEDGELILCRDTARRAQVKYRVPCGYSPLRPHHGITFTPDDDCIPVEMPPHPKHKILLLSGNELMTEEDALTHIEASFPGIHPEYLLGCLAAGICAQAGHGPPPMATCSGPSGSGKWETVRLAASFMGQDLRKLQLLDDSEKFMRQIGTALVSGHTFLGFDELGKVKSLARKLHLFLQISSMITWRPLYGREIDTKCRAAFFFPCVRFPPFLRTSAEFLRRTRHCWLYRKVPNWGETSGGDTADWRDRSPDNAAAANSILTHVWRLCKKHEFRFL